MGNFIPERVLDEIKFRNDIVEVIGSYITLKRMGSSYKACCPFHKEKTPSFNVTPGMQIFKCFGCGEGGNVISFVQKYQGVSFIEACKILADRVGIDLELQKDSGASKHRKIIFEINDGIAKFYQRCLQQTPSAEIARKYLKKRKLEGEIVDSFQVGYAPDGWKVSAVWAEKHNYTLDQLEEAGLVLRSQKEGSRNRFYDRFRNRLMFPIHDSQGRVIGFSARILVDDKKAPKYVNSPETPVFHKGRILYGLDKARKHIVNAPNREAVICEGQIDVVRCHLAGINTAIAAQGTAFTGDHAKALKNYADSIVLAFDSDGAGKKAAIKAAIIFMDAGIAVRIAEIPDGEDPDSFIQANGSVKFRKLLEDAISLIEFQIKTLSAKEKDADSVAATNRIAKAVLHSICHSSNAVQKARLLQEASKLLNIPEKALEEDLEGIAEEEKRTAERQTKLARRKVESSDVGNYSNQVMSAQLYEEEPPPSLYNTDEFEPDYNTPSLKRSQPRISLEEQALCEHVVHVVDYPELAQIIKEYLPLSMIQNDTCRKLISYALDALEQNNDLLEELLAEGDDAAEVLAYAEKLISAPVKVTGTRDYSPNDAVQDLILNLWRSKLERERREIRAKGNAITPEESDRRRQIVLDLQHLKRWEKGSEVIAIEREIENFN